MQENSRFTILPNGKIEITAPTPSMGFNSPSWTKDDKERLLQGHDMSSKKLLVLYNPAYNQVLHDPMTGKPVASRFKKFLEPIAKEYKCEILTVDEAFKKILSHGPTKLDPNSPV